MRQVLDGEVGRARCLANSKRKEAERRIGFRRWLWWWLARETALFLYITSSGGSFHGNFLKKNTWNHF